MVVPDENPLKSKEELISIGQKTLADLYDAATSDLAKLKIQRYWYQALHEFSADVMALVVNGDYEPDRCPSDMERCRDGSCMPPGQC